MESSLGSMAMLGKLLEEHRPRLRSMLERRIDPRLTVRVDADDLLNETFLLARTKYDEFRRQGRMSAYAWLYRIALDCLIEAWRRETRHRRDLGRDLPFPAESATQIALGLVGSGTSPSEAAARRQLQERMARVLDLLPPRDREVLWMRHFDQLSHREAADVLDISEPAVTLRYVRALRRLKDLWQKLYGEPE